MSDFTTNSPVAVRLQELGIKPGQVHIPAAQYEELLSLSEAWQKARTCLQEAQVSAQEIHETARQEGLAAGQEDAVAFAMEKVAQMQGTMHEWVKGTDAQLIELVSRCVGEVVNKIDPAVLVKDSVEKGLAQLASAQQIIVRVHPDTPNLQETIEAVTAKYGITGTVRLVQDGTLRAGDVVVESPVGTVDLRLDNQLKLISKALKP